MVKNGEWESQADLSQITTLSQVFSKVKQIFIVKVIEADLDPGVYSLMITHLNWTALFNTNDTLCYPYLYEIQVFFLLIFPT